MNLAGIGYTNEKRTGGGGCSNLLKGFVIPDSWYPLEVPVVKSFSPSKTLSLEGKGQRRHQHKGAIRQLLNVKLWKGRDWLEDAKGAGFHLVQVGTLVVQPVKFHGTIMRIAFWQGQALSGYHSLVYERMEGKFIFCGDISQYGGGCFVEL